ncbi:hypothetical protein HPP92_024356 [Vanilla planifolia]|uniref:Uncharacterized protein n=1 Tax=Vanilla planifolia TaxID=51239 RepID=A0A835PPK4_VANPL|nr:hypothetical protein HPP92_024356 [Vanilla planifolia]
MGSSIALAFSKVVDPANPLYLEDSCHEDMDWEFGLLSLTKEPRGANENKFNNIESKNLHRDADHSGFGKKLKKVKDEPRYNTTKVSESGSRHVNDNDSSDDESKNSQASSDSSLQPYDLSDDDIDLKKRITQLADIIAALRKPDDSDGIERALDVAEKLIRASPDELRHSSGDLVRALIFVRCSDIAVEGQEDSAEERRQKALVALTVTPRPGLSDATFTKCEWSSRNLISSVSLSQPWFVPSNRGPPGAGYDKKRHGVDCWRDFIVLGKLVHMLGVSSSILVSLHPSFVASALIEGNQEISNGLEWIRTWALHITESDPETDCSTMAMGCLQLHSELALETSRCLETAQTYIPKVSSLPQKVNNIIIPLSNR